MKKTTRKLGGQAKDRFLARFFAEEPGLAPDLAERLTRRAVATFTSLRVRRIAWGLPKRRDSAGPVRQPIAPVPAPAAIAPRPEPSPETSPAFDPYIFGLVPVFQREGRDGLLGKLATIASADDLRAMARTQQIVLPAELRKGDASPDALRTAIADAVAKRIADRRAAAG